MMLRAAIPVLLALTLAACGQAPGTSTAAARQAGVAARGPLARVSAAAPGVMTKAQAQLARADFFPTEPGHVWQYDVVGHPSDDPYVDFPGIETVVVQKATRKGSRTAIALRALDDFTGRYRYPTLTWDEGGVTLGDVTYWGPMAVTAERHSINLLRFPLQVGSKWDDGQWIGELLREETVTVPAGTFKAYKVSTIGTYDNAYTVVGDYWFAPGVGIVKSNLNTPDGSFESRLLPAGKVKPVQPKK